MITTLQALASDPVELRRLHLEASEQLGVLPLSSSSRVRLAKVIWELLTNLEHAAVASGSIVFVTISDGPPHIMVRTPGSPFDSVARAGVSGARGLDSAAWLVDLCAWQWSHRYIDGFNEIALEEKR